MITGGNMGGIKRKSEAVLLLNRPALLAKIRQMSSKRNRALAAFIYLTGARISEILGTIKRIPDSPDIEIIPIKKEDIEIIESDDLMIVHNVACLKRKDKLPRRTIPIIMSQERGFVDIFLSHFNDLQDEDNLFNIKRKQAWNIINKELGIFCHFLIHERCTHLVTHKAFTDLDLKQFRGWSSTMMASTYTHLNYTDLARKMR